MPKTAIIIPARNEQYLTKTVDDVFAKANAARTEQLPKLRKKASGDNNNINQNKQYDMYKNIRPLASERFWTDIQQDDVFHAHLKHLKEDGESLEDEKVRSSILFIAKSHAKEKLMRGRLESSDLMILEDDDDINVDD